MGGGVGVLCAMRVEFSCEQRMAVGSVAGSLTPQSDYRRMGMGLLGSEHLD